MRPPQEIAGLMAAYGPSPDDQILQSAFRQKLARDWGIQPGDRILEIGCGQGDTTAVLADIVGPHGHVSAVDFAEPSYGSPVTLGDSAKHLKSGPLGEQIDFDFEFDVLNAHFEESEFDVIVLAHCTWYFQDLLQLKKTLDKIKLWGPKLCLSEWDLKPNNVHQMAHLLAVLIQGQTEAFKTDSQANVRSPYSLETLQQILEETGWRISSHRYIDSTGLSDGRWEVEGCLNQTSVESDQLDLPPKLKSLVKSQLDVLNRISQLTENRPLPAYSIVAIRN